MTNSLLSKRNHAIDILRALVMTLMVFVNDLGHVAFPHWMGHATLEEDFLGLSDIVFPCFLFVVGMSIPYAIENSFSKGKTGQQVAGHIITRTLALLLMGVFLVNLEGGISPEVGINPQLFKLLLVTSFILIWNAYPKTENIKRRYVYKALKWIGIILFVFLAVIFEDKGGNMLRPKWWGILGLIGWTYFVCAFVYYFTRNKLKWLIPIWGIFVIWCMLKCKTLQTGTPLLNLPAGNALDAFAQILHIDTGAHCALAMGGIILSVMDIKVRNIENGRRIIYAVALTSFLVVLGAVSNIFWPISKLYATIPWVFYSSAIATGVYSLLTWAVECGKAHWFNVIGAAGTATLTCYLMPYVWLSILSWTGIGTARPEWCSTGILGILTCLGFSLLCIWTTSLIGKAGIKLKV